jgi:hypothetical protein
MFNMPIQLLPQIYDVIFNVSPDSKRFLVTRPDEAANAGTFIFITNWFDDLRKRWR